MDDVRGGFFKGIWWYCLFDGYNFMIWFVVVNFGCIGFLVLWIMKYVDSIVKVIF